MRKDKRKTSEPKGVYRVRNWPEYNAGLIERGNVTMWIDEDVLTNPAASAARRRGRPCIYADAAIQMLLGLKQVFRLPLRTLQGFAQSQRDLAFSGLPVPNYTTLSRRAQKLEVVLPAPRSGEPLHLVIDSTGLKLYGEGEWNEDHAGKVQGGDECDGYNHAEDACEIFVPCVAWHGLRRIPGGAGFRKAV